MARENFFLIPGQAVVGDATEKLKIATQQLTILLEIWREFTDKIGICIACGAQAELDGENVQSKLVEGTLTADEKDRVDIPHDYLDCPYKKVELFTELLQNQEGSVNE
jgi:hypothetical protein